MGKITKVPNGPLIKKKGPYAGSTLRSGGTIKKAQNGDTLSVKKPMTYAEKRAAQEIVKERNRRLRDSILNRNAAARGMTRAEVQAQQEKDKKKPDAQLEGTRCIGKDDPGCAGSAGARERRVKREARRKNGGPIKKAQGGKRVTRWMTDEEYKKSNDSLSKKIKNIDPGFTISPKGSRKNTDPGFMKTPSNYDPNTKRKRVTSEDGMLQYLKNGNKIKKAKAGTMIKRADGSYSQRGLWDNIRANKGSGKKPTKQMLVQEKKIKAKTKK